MNGVHSIESLSLALHAAVAKRLLDDPVLWERARKRIERWRLEGSRHVYFLGPWDELLSAPLRSVADAIVDPGERGQRLRRASPFAFVLRPAERLAILRAERGASGGREASGRS